MSQTTTTTTTKSEMSKTNEPFDEELFETRLEALKDTQECIQQMSNWCLQHRLNHKKIIQCWLNVFKRGVYHYYASLVSLLLAITPTPLCHSSCRSSIGFVLSGQRCHPVQQTQALRICRMLGDSAPKSHHDGAVSRTRRIAITRLTDTLQMFNLLFLFCHCLFMLLITFKKICFFMCILFIVICCQLSIVVSI